MEAESLQALVIESNFSSRKEMVSALKETNFTSRIREALSVNDGLSLLAKGESDVCLLGPALSVERSIFFLNESRKINLLKPCGFIAVTSDKIDEAQRTSLIVAGADVTTTRPLSPQTFTEIVKEAVKLSRTRPPVGDFSTMPLAQQIEKLFVPDASPGPPQVVLSTALGDLAARFQYLAEEFAHGRLKMNATGEPSLAGKDALRLVIESTFPVDAEVGSIGSSDHFFITVLVEWFAERTQMSSKKASDSLRRKLLSFIKQTTA